MQTRDVAALAPEYSAWWTLFRPLPPLQIASAVHPTLSNLLTCSLPSCFRLSVWVRRAVFRRDAALSPSLPAVAVPPRASASLCTRRIPRATRSLLARSHLRLLSSADIPLSSSRQLLAVPLISPHRSYYIDRYIDSFQLPLVSSFSKLGDRRLLSSPLLSISFYFWEWDVSHLRQRASLLLITILI